MLDGGRATDSMQAADVWMSWVAVMLVANAEIQLGQFVDWLCIGAVVYYKWPLVEDTIGEQREP